MGHTIRYAFITFLSLLFISSITIAKPSYTEEGDMEQKSKSKQGVEIEKDSFINKISLDGELKNEESFYSLSDSKLNQDNRLRLPTMESISMASLAPKVILGEESFLKGLISAEYNLQKNGHTKEDKEIKIKEFYLSTAYRKIALEIGRERVRWGVGYCASPTDVVTDMRRPGDPEDRLNRVKGADLAKMDILFKDSSLILVYLPDLEVKEGDINNHSGAMKYSFFINRFDVATVLRIGEDKKATAGINLSYVIGEALEVHGEFLWSRKQEAVSPDYYNGTDALYNKPPYKIKDNPAYYTILGGQYTLKINEENALNIVLEYYRNGDGLSRDEIAALNDHIEYSYELSAEQGYYQLLWATNVYRFPLGTNYLFLRFDYPFFEDKLRAELNTLYSLTDSSFFSQPILTWDVNDALSLSIRCATSYGDDNSEAYLSPIKYVMRMGGTYHF
ncbi:MAG: hypothetical protein V1872_13680 [bacterium]